MENLSLFDRLDLHILLHLKKLLLSFIKIIINYFNNFKIFYLKIKL